MKANPVVSPKEWLEARQALLAKEKELTRLRDELGEARRALPWVKVAKPYAFDGPTGKRTLDELFEGRSQLVVYHFMFAPEQDAGCPHCSFWADNFERIIVHLNQRDASMVAISRAPQAKLAAYQKRMGWTFQWLSSGATDFNYDFQASFTPEELAAKRAHYNFTMQNPGRADREGVSVFYKDASGDIFHTYSAYARGIDVLNAAYHFMDILPKGRDEGGRAQYWVRRHDEYGR
jgi:predicted dithiol-disulfide oxidoreductase (DUF899 family)